jgi:hypothetical protein
MAAQIHRDTARLRIRPWRPDEAARMFDIHRREEVVRWFGPPAVMTDPSEAAARIEKYRSYDAPLGSWVARRPGRRCAARRGK